MDLIIQISLDNLDSRETQFENYFVFIGSLRNHIQTFKKAEQREPECNISKEEKNIVFFLLHYNISWNDFYLKLLNLFVYWRHEVKKVCYLTCISNRLKSIRLFVLNCVKYCHQNSDFPIAPASWVTTPKVMFGKRKSKDTVVNHRLLRNSTFWKI